MIAVKLGQLVRVAVDVNGRERVYLVDVDEVHESGFMGTARKRVRGVDLPGAGSHVSVRGDHVTVCGGRGISRYKVTSAAVVL